MGKAISIIIAIVFVVWMARSCGGSSLAPADYKSLTDTAAAYQPIYVEDPVAKKKFQNSKAGKIQKKHSSWSNEDCERVARREIWIGMEYDMLIYERGKPNTVNTSNYGAGNQYQCCWEGYSPSCFYMGADDIITAYN